MPPKFKTTPPPGICGNPRCDAKRQKGSYLCREHTKEMDRIRKEMLDDPRLLYNKRADNPKRKYTQPMSVRGRGKRGPVCCAVGCYNERVPPDPFCDMHRDLPLEDGE